MPFYLLVFETFKTNTRNNPLRNIEKIRISLNRSDRRSCQNVDLFFQDSYGNFYQPSNFTFERSF